MKNGSADSLEELSEDNVLLVGLLVALASSLITLVTDRLPLVTPYSDGSSRQSVVMTNRKFPSNAPWGLPPGTGLRVDRDLLTE